jgi:hypothetical protein
MYLLQANPTKKVCHNKRLRKIELNEYFSPTYEVDVAQSEGPLKKSIRQCMVAAATYVLSISRRRSSKNKASLDCNHDLDPKQRQIQIDHYTTEAVRRTAEHHKELTTSAIGNAESAAQSLQT